MAAQEGGLLGEEDSAGRMAAQGGGQLGEEGSTGQSREEGLQAWV